MISAIQSKVLRLHGTSLAHMTTGKVVNLVSNDVRRFDEAGTFWVFIIGGPCELLAVFILVGIRMGFLASFAGVSSLLLLIPLQAFLAKYIARLRMATAAQTDHRVKLTGEAITGALAFKMLAWEDPLYKEIMRIREEEKKYIKWMNVIRAFNFALTFAISPLVNLLVFTVARYTGAALTVGNIFYSISLLSLPKLFMCEFFVHGVESMSESAVAVQRIGEFLAVEEPEPFHLTTHSENFNGSDEDNDDTVVKIVRSDFSWGYNVCMASVSGEDTRNLHQIALHDFSLTVKEGELIAIVGPVGSGKSSIIASILGELTPVGGSFADTVFISANNLTYCPQQAFILGGTIRENILFGQEMDEERYIRCIKASSFDFDLANMPHGDETEIGERGISLSGGQKARLSLVRAAYFQSGPRTLHLLDDPLSAVDARVGDTIFHDCIGPDGVMAGSTRLLVTHQKQYLPFCDRILVLKDGIVVAEGTYDHLVEQGVTDVIMGIDKGE